jgi:hypothetical protein
MENLKFDKLVDTVLEKKEKRQLPPAFRQGGGQRQSGSGYHTNDKQKALKRANLKRETEKDLHEAKDIAYYKLPEMLAQRWHSHIVKETTGIYKDTPKEVIRSALQILSGYLSQMAR